MTNIFCGQRNCIHNIDGVCIKRNIAIGVIHGIGCYTSYEPSNKGKNVNNNHNYD